MDARRILLVEDEALVALYTANVLKNAGYEVVGPANSLDSALRLARSEPLDAAVLDVNIAGTNVWPVAGILSERHIGFVFLTGFSSDLDVPQTLQAAPRVAKPFRRQALLEALATIF